MRCSMNAAPPRCELLAQKTAPRATLGEVFRSHSREVLCGLGSVIALTVTIYVLISYLPTFAVKQLKLPDAQSFYAVIVGNLLLTVLSPLTGAWSDRIGHKGLSLWPLVITLTIIYPLSAIRYPLSAIRYPLSAIRYPLSAIRLARRLSQRIETDCRAGASVARWLLDVRR